MKAIYFLLLLFTVTSFSQTSTEKYNTYLRRYEYFDSQGNLTGYKQYNTYLNQWEYYNSQNNNYKPQSSVDLDLVSKTLNTKQEKYDSNLIRIKNKIKQIYHNIDYIVLKFGKEDNPTAMDYKYAEHLKILFQNQYIKSIEKKEYDYSNNITTEDLISYLEKGSIGIITKELEFYKEANIDYYYTITNKYISLF